MESVLFKFRLKGASGKLQKCLSIHDEETTKQHLFSLFGKEVVSILIDDGESDGPGVSFNGGSYERVEPLQQAPPEQAQDQSPPPPQAESDWRGIFGENAGRI